MLRIIVVANTYQEAKRYVEYKFKNRIDKVNSVINMYTLIDGNVLYFCYDEQSKNKYKNAEYDAMIIHPDYQSLADVIRRRVAR